MRFYRINMYIDVECKEDEESQNTRRIRKLIDRTFAESIAAKSEKYAEKIADKGYLFLGCTTQALCVFGMIIRENMDVEKYINNYSNYTHIGVNEIDIREITLNDFVQLLNEADRNGYIYDDYEVLREYELTELVRPNHRGGGISYSEDMIKVRNREAIYLASKTYFTKETFIPELDRIYTRTNRNKAFGHPVDYLIETDDERTQNGMIQLLLQALYSVGRIENRRYCTLDVEPDMNFSKRAAEALYKSCVGGTVIVDFYTYEEDDDDLAHGEYSFMEDLCSIIKRHCCDVLTVLCLPRECKNLKAKIFENTGKCTFVEIKESLAVDDEAVMYLKRRAKEYKVRTDKQLLQSIEKGNGYLAHYVHFEDYNSDELCQIAEFIASQKGLKLDDGARKKIKIIMDNARGQADFGNGRFVRNVIEKAKIAQNCRLVRMDYDSVTIDDVKRICAEDIVIPMNESRKTNHRIGFAV